MHRHAAFVIVAVGVEVKTVRVVAGEVTSDCYDEPQPASERAVAASGCSGGGEGTQLREEEDVLQSTY